MKWTKKQPNDEGFYFYKFTTVRHGGYVRPPEPVWLIRTGGKIGWHVLLFGDPEPHTHSELGGKFGDKIG